MSPWTVRKTLGGTLAGVSPALLGGTRAGVARAIEADFPHLPAGCEIQLDRASQRAVLDNVRGSLRAGWGYLAEDLAACGDVSLPEFLRRAEVELEDVYATKRCFTELKHRAGLRAGPMPKTKLAAALPRLLHIDDPLRLETWGRWLTQPQPPAPDPDDPMQLMLLGAVDAGRPIAELGGFFADLWAAPDLRGELRELLAELADRRRRPTIPLGDIPLHIHATYSRAEVIAGLGKLSKEKLLPTQAGVLMDEATRSDSLFVTLEKDERHFTPTTLYNDYPISPARFHWESQAATRADSETGRRYQDHAARGWRIFLFVRRRKHDERGATMPYLFLGPVRYVSHQAEKPMQIVWALDHPMPPDFYRDVKVAAG